MSAPIRLVVVAATMAVRAGLRALLQAAPAGEPAFEVIWEAGSPADIEVLPPETGVLLAVSGAASEAGLARLLRAQDGPLALLLLTDDPQATQGLLSLPLRAWGVLTLDASPEELAVAVRAVHEGLLVGSPALLETALPQLLAAGEARVEPLVEPLTEREIQVLQLLAQGLANKQIGAALGISEHTVKFHVSSIYTKLGATNRTEAARLGVQRGLVSL